MFESAFGVFIADVWYWFKLMLWVGVDNTGKFPSMNFLSDLTYSTRELYADCRELFPKDFYALDALPF